MPGYTKNICLPRITVMRMQARIRELEAAVEMLGGGMARGNPFTKEQQIRGLKKALANRKTPAAFRAGMKKRLAKLQGK